MLSAVEFQFNSYSGRTGENCDEINRGRVNNGSGDSEIGASAAINRIDGFSQTGNVDNDLYAQLSRATTQSLFKVSIRDFERRGEGKNSYIVYKIQTEINGAVGYGFTKQNYSTWRRFSDFIGLHGRVAEKYFDNGMDIPSPPKKTDSDPTMSPHAAIIQAGLLEKYISSLVQYPGMKNDSDILDFLAIDSNLPKAVEDTALLASGVRNLFNSVQDVIYKLTIDMEEGDRWIEHVQPEVDVLNEALRKMHSFTENSLTPQRDMICSEKKFGQAYPFLAACEDSTTHSKMQSDFAGVWGKQAEINNSKFSESIQEYIMLIGALKEVFSERHRAWQQWQDAKKTLAGKRDQKSKQFEVEIEEVIQKMDQFGRDFEDHRKTVREEVVVRFDAEKNQDVKTMLTAYIETMIHKHSEKQLKPTESIETVKSDLPMAVQTTTVSSCGDRELLKKILDEIAKMDFSRKEDGKALSFEEACEESAKLAETRLYLTGESMKFGVFYDSCHKLMLWFAVELEKLEDLRIKVTQTDYSKFEENNLDLMKQFGATVKTLLKKVTDVSEILVGLEEPLTNRRTLSFTLSRLCDLSVTMQQQWTSLVTDLRDTQEQVQKSADDSIRVSSLQFITNALETEMRWTNERIILDSAKVESAVYLTMAELIIDLLWNNLQNESLNHLITPTRARFLLPPRVSLSGKRIPRIRLPPQSKSHTRVDYVQCSIS